MDYQEFIDDIKELDFIEDEETADAAIRAVLGILASSLEEEDAKTIVSSLPEPLDMTNLRGQQAGVTPVTFDDCVVQVGRQFNMDEEDARVLVDTVLRSTRAALGGDKLAQVEEILPESWRIAIENA